MEHVAARAKVGKATIYRHWPTKQALALEVLLELATPHIAVPDVGDTRTELLATVLAPDAGAHRDGLRPGHPRAALGDRAQSGAG